MSRSLLPAVFAAVFVAVTNDSAVALVAFAPQPGQSAITAPVVLTGKVTAVEKDLVEVPSPYAGSKDKQTYKLAVVKVDTGLSGIDAAKVKEIKVGVFQPPKPAPNPGGAPPAGIRPPRGPAVAVELKEGQEFLLFLVKHPSADLYLVTGAGAPVDLATPEGKKALAEVKKVTATLADPLKGLKSEKAEVRVETAGVLIAKYRAYPVLGGPTELVAIPADESKLILKALAEGDWKPTRFGTPGPFSSFGQLGLTEKDGWIQPVVVNVPGQPSPDYAEVLKDAYTKWLAGPGKDYQIKKLVPKK